MDSFHSRVRDSKGGETRERDSRNETVQNLAAVHIRGRSPRRPRLRGGMGAVRGPHPATGRGGSGSCAAMPCADIPSLGGAMDSAAISGMCGHTLAPAATMNSLGLCSAQRGRSLSPSL